MRNRPDSYLMTAATALRPDLRRYALALSTALPLLFSLNTVSAAEIYKCQHDGRTVFSQHPCADDAEVVDEESLSQPTGSGAQSGFVESVDKSADRSLAIAAIDRQISGIRNRALQQVQDNEAERSRCMDRIANQAASDTDVDRNVMLRACHQSLIDRNNELIRQADSRLRALMEQKNELLLGPDREGGIARKPLD